MDWQTVKDTAIHLYDKLHVVHMEYFSLWRTSILFSWRWWIAVSLIVVPWTLWAIVHKRGSTHRLLYAGSIIAILSSLMDMIGVTLHYWTYPVTVFPMMPSYIPFDLSSMPVATMLWLQFFPRMKLIWKTLIYAAVGGFIFEPLSDGIGLVVQEGWNYIYSFIIMFFMYLLAYWLSTRKHFDPINRDDKKDTV